MYGYIKREILRWTYRLVVEWASEDQLDNVDKHYGSCFFISCGSKGLVVTNRHLIDPKYQKPLTKRLQCFSIVGFDTQSKPIKINGKAEDTITHYSANSEEDVAIIAPISMWEVEGSGEVCWIHRDWHLYDDQFSQEMELCDLVTIPGFPRHFDRNSQKPIARMGTIASDPGDDYCGPGHGLAKRTAYEAMSTSGNSGGPVFAVARGISTDLRPGVPRYRPAKLIGVNAGHFEDRSTHSHEGISYFFRAQVIKDICDTAALSID